MKAKVFGLVSQLCGVIGRSTRALRNVWWLLVVEDLFV